MQLDHESVYCVDPGVSSRVDPGVSPRDEPRRVTFDTNRPNGVLLNADESELYVAESPHRRDQRRQLRAYPIAADGSLGEHRVLHDFADGRGVDGMTRTAEWPHRGYGRPPRARPRTDDLRVRAVGTGRVDASLARPTNPPTAPSHEAERGVLYVTFSGGELYRVANTGLRGAV